MAVMTHLRRLCFATWWQSRNHITHEGQRELHPSMNATSSSLSSFADRTLAFLFLKNSMIVDRLLRSQQRLPCRCRAISLLQLASHSHSIPGTVVIELLSFPCGPSSSVVVRSRNSGLGIVDRRLMRDPGGSRMGKGKTVSKGAKGVNEGRRRQKAGTTSRTSPGYQKPL